MAIEKVINIKVNDSEVNDLTNDLNALDTSLARVEGQSEKTSTSLKDVGENGGAIALLDELTGGLATKVRDAAEATKLFNFSLKGTRTALIATGIGAFVVALGTVVAYWDEIVEFITKANRTLQRQIDTQNKILDNLDYELDLLDIKEKILEKEGKSNEEIRKQKEAIILLQQEENILLLDKLQTQLEIEQKQVQELTFWEKVKVGILGAAGAYQQAADAAAEAVIGDEEEQVRLKEIEDQIAEATLRREQLKLDLLNLTTPDTTGQETEGRQRDTALEGLTGEDAAADIERRRQAFAEIFELEKLQQEQLDQLGKDALNEALNNEQVLMAVQDQNRKQTLLQVKALREQEVAYAKQGLDAISNVLGKSSAAGKAVAVASALINTYQGISAELATKTATPFEFGLKLANIASVTAIGFKTVRDILATKLPNFAGSAGSASAGGAATSAPSFNVVGTSGTSQIAQTLNQEQEPIEAYVVASNVTSAQEANRDIVDNATLG